METDGDERRHRRHYSASMGPRLNSYGDFLAELDSEIAVLASMGPRLNSHGDFSVGLST